MGKDAFSNNPFSREQWSRPCARSGDRMVCQRSASGPAGAEEVPMDVLSLPVARPRRRTSQAVGKAGFGRGAFPRETAAAMGALRFLPWVAAAALTVFLLCAAVEALQGYVADAIGPQEVVSAPLPVTAATADEPPTSTPRDQWRKGEVPHLYQIDAAWANVPYAGDTVGTSGCGPTSLAMVYVALTGDTDYDPPAMAQFSERNGYVEEGLTAWRLMTDGAAQLGLASCEVPASADRLAAELLEGRPVICTVGPGDFTETGHFIVVAGLADDGTLVVHDPNSAENSAKTWDAQRVLSQCRNLWAFERA